MVIFKRIPARGNGWSEHLSPLFSPAILELGMQSPRRPGALTPLLQMAAEGECGRSIADEISADCDTFQSQHPGEILPTDNLTGQRGGGRSGEAYAEMEG